MTITVHLGPGETIGQALIRAGLIAQESDTITIPPGVHIVNPNIRRTRIIERRTTGIPFLTPSAEAVLREAAEWLRSEYPQREGCGTAWANMLDNEANL